MMSLIINVIGFEELCFSILLGMFTTDRLVQRG
jgi:hypothetical protein